MVLMSAGCYWHEDVMRSLQEFAAGGVDEDAVVFCGGAAGG